MNTINQAKSALNDLLGLIPIDDRKYAIDNIRIIEQALYGYSQALDFQREISSKLYHAEEEQKLVGQALAEIAA